MSVNYPRDPPKSLRQKFEEIPSIIRKVYLEYTLYIYIYIYTYIHTYIHTQSYIIEVKLYTLNIYIYIYTCVYIYIYPPADVSVMIRKQKHTIKRHHL